MMREFLKALGFGLAVGLPCMFAILYAPMAELRKVTLELQKERDMNSRHVRRVKWMNRPPYVNLESVELAYHILGSKPSVSAALLFNENGPIYVETGALAKTDFFTQFKIENRSSLEGGRALNRMAWEWFTNTDEGKLAFVQFLGHASYAYTKNPGAQQRHWASNMLKLEEKFSKDISWANNGDHGELRNLKPAPTPDYKFVDSPQKATGKPKFPVRRKKL